MTKPWIGIGADVLVQEEFRDRAFSYVTYTEALRHAGAIPVIVPPQPENAAELVGMFDGILLAGGFDCDPSLYGEPPHQTLEPMDPRRQSNDFALAAAARELGIPTLGICLGLQVMNVAAGGSLIQDIDSQRETAIRHASHPLSRVRHALSIVPDTRLAAILGAEEIDVNSSHHQAVASVGRGLRTTAVAPDGIVEGLEDPDHPFYVGVQWHPEDMTSEGSAERLFRAFLEAARRRADVKNQGTVSSPAGISLSE